MDLKQASVGELAAELVSRDEPCILAMYNSTATEVGVMINGKSDAVEELAAITVMTLTGKIPDSVKVDEIIGSKAADKHDASLN